jgi:hypothetical protein
MAARRRRAAADDSNAARLARTHHRGRPGGPGNGPRPPRAPGAEMTQRFPPWDDNVVQGIADILDATDTGLYGPEVGRFPAGIGIPDPGAGITKRHRLGQSLLTGQARDGAADCVIRFITDAMAPVRYVQEPGLRTLRQDGCRATVERQWFGVTNTTVVPPRPRLLAGSARRAV